MIFSFLAGRIGARCAPVSPCGRWAVARGSALAQRWLARMPNAVPTLATHALARHSGLDPESSFSLANAYALQHAQHQAQTNAPQGDSNHQLHTAQGHLVQQARADPGAEEGTERADEDRQQQSGVRLQRGTQIA